MPRMRIFNSLEEDAFESPPRFNSAERKRFFTLPATLSPSIANLRTPTNKVCFLLVVGYFKSRRKFFNREFRAADIAFAAKQVGVNPADVNIDGYSKETFIRHQRLILVHFGFVPFDAAAKAIAIREIAELVRVQFRPKLVLLDAIQALTRLKIVLPSYNMLADLVCGEFNHYQQSLGELIDKCLTDEQRARLDELLTKEPGRGAGKDEGWRYQLTLLKKPYQSTQPAKIRANIADLCTLQAYYLNLKPVMDRLNLRYECVRYYAYSVIKAQIPQVSRRGDKSRYLLLIAFVVYQTFKLNDTLIDTLLSAVQATINAAQKAHKEAYFEEREQRAQSFSALAERLRQSIRTTLSEIKRIVAAPGLSDSQKVSMIDTALEEQNANPSGVDQQIDQFKHNLVALQNGRDYFDMLEERSLKLQHRVADIVRQVQFSSDCSKSALWEAVTHYQKKDGVIDKNAPVTFLTTEQSAALIDADGKFRVSLYKALLFVEIADKIKSGALNLVHSEKYRSLEEYLISKADWEVHHDEYLQRAQLDQFTDCQATLRQLDAALDTRFREVNVRYKAGDNPHLTVRANGTFHVSTPKLEENDAASLGIFFPDRKFIPLVEALATVDQAAGFLNEFEHWQVKYQRDQPAKKVLFAAIIGFGCDIGHRKLAQISKEIDEGELDRVVNWYFSLQNVQGANDRVLQLMERLSLPNIYRRQGALHTSSDGQKFGVAVDSLNANYSYKYLGKDKGVSVVTFIDMRDFMWHSTVISSSEREAAYVIDGLMHNDVVKSDIHSTDTHGYSEIIFGAACMLGIEFAPRIKGVGKQQLYAFKPPKYYEGLDYSLLPDRAIREPIVEAQWDEILRFMATIRLKVTTASQLFKRLNSYSRQHPLYQALKEFGKAPKTLHILKFADDVRFRQAIEKQLNKVEGSNKFSKAVSFGQNQEFTQSEKEEQEIAEACRRLIKNVIICWNYLYLSRELERTQDETRRTELLEAIRNGSVSTWRHFNLHGEFDFSEAKMADSVGLTSPKEPIPKRH